MVNKVRKLLPISKIVLEVNKFDFASMENPKIQNWQYQRGSLYGYNSLKDAVAYQQGNHCLFCERKIEQYHHIVPKSKGGSDTIGNMVGLCAEHHDRVHKDENYTTKLAVIKQGITKKYGALSVLNQIMPQLIDSLNEICPTEVTDGFSTACFRKYYNIEKSHSSDAYCIACSILDTFEVDRNRVEVFRLKQFRRQDRQACHQERVNRCYYLEGKLVATNRHKATEQKVDSLEEYKAKGGKTDRLVIKEHPSIYKDMRRVMPGALMRVNGNEYKVLQGSQGRTKTKKGSRPSYYIFTDGSRATLRCCELIRRNEGIVYI